jgi:mono/diheme cytochrome c family protein
MAYTPAQVDAGQALYEANCAECHGDSAAGDGPRASELSRPVPDLTDQNRAVSLSDAEIFNVVTEGLGPQMPAFGDDLTDEQRRAVVTYLRSLSLANTDAIGAPPEATQESTADATAFVSTMTVTGQVSNGTAGGTLPGELPITLYTVIETSEGLQNTQANTTADSQGRFTFADFTVDSDASYVATTTYRERLFTSEILTGAQLAQSANIPITIYELTEDPTVIRITSATMQINGAGDGLQILQDVIFHNTSDRLYTNSLKVDETNYASVVVGLPPGAVSVAFPNNTNRYVYGQEQNVVVDTIPVLPGEDHEVQFSYFLPYDVGGAVIEQPVYYTADGVARVAVSPASLIVSGDSFVLNADETAVSSVYQVYTEDISLQAGGAIRFDLGGSTAPTQTPTGLPSNVLLIAGLVIEIVLIGLVLYWILQRRRRKTAAPPNRQALIDGLIRQIAELDNLHEAGRVDEASYQGQRAQLKARLAELMENEN